MKQTITSLTLDKEPARSQINSLAKKPSVLETLSLYIKKVRLEYFNYKLSKKSLIYAPFVVAPVLIFTVLGYYSFFYKPNSVLGVSTEPSYNVYANNVKDLSTYDVTAKTKDARSEKVKLFFEKYDAPLSEHSDYIVEMADKYGIDWKLVSAIGYCEGNGGKAIPENSFNTWGWAASEKDLAERSGRYRLGSWEQAIETVTRGLKKGYIDQGLETPEQIMAKYAPPSVAKGGPWAKCVNQYLEEIDNIN